MAGKDKDKFKAVEKTLLSYYGPNEKRKQNTLAKKKEARSIKKGYTEVKVVFGLVSIASIFR